MSTSFTALVNSLGWRVVRETGDGGFGKCPESVGKVLASGDGHPLTARLEGTGLEEAV